jgi:hypothetical protein
MESFMTDRTEERRCAARLGRPEDHGIVAARIRPGHDAAIVDVSDDGVLIETAHRLMPGRIVELVLERQSGKASVRGCVLRCAVARVRPSSVSYRGAIGFDRALAWYSEAGAGEHRLSTGATRPGIAMRADATPQVV